MVTLRVSHAARQSESLCVSDLPRVVTLRISHSARQRESRQTRVTLWAPPSAPPRSGARPRAMPRARDGSGAGAGRRPPPVLDDRLRHRVTPRPVTGWTSLVVAGPCGWAAQAASSSDLSHHCRGKTCRVYREPSSAPLGECVAFNRRTTRIAIGSRCVHENETKQRGVIEVQDALHLCDMRVKVREGEVVDDGNSVFTYLSLGLIPWSVYPSIQ